MDEGHPTAPAPADPNGGGAREALLGHSLAETFARARRMSPFYRDFHAEAPAIHTLVDLLQVPTIDKARFAAHSLQMCVSREFPARMGFTSGTEVPLRVPHHLRTFQGAAELELWRELALRRGRVTDGPRPLMLKIVTAMHGSPLNANPDGTLLVPLENPSHFGHIRELLAGRYDFAGCTDRVRVLSASAEHLKLLTALLLHHGPQVLEDLRLDAVVSSAWLLTERWRRVFEQTYRCPVYNVYGLSEIPGSTCTESFRDPGIFRFAAAVVGEVLPLDRDDQRVADGIGELTLTTLYPFSQLQPVLRYRTGDLAQVVADYGQPGAFSFRLHGRKSGALWDAAGQLVIPPIALFECVDALPEVAREPLDDFRHFEIGQPFGRPRFQARVEPGALVVELELVVHPDFFPERAAQVRTALTDQLAVHVLTDHDVRVLLRGPGAAALRGKLH